MKKSDLFLAILVTCIWGANFSVIKLGLGQLDPFMLTSLRFALSAVPLIFFVKKPNTGIHIVALYGTIFGVGLWGMVNLGIYVGLSAGLASLILQFSAFFTIILATFSFGESISTSQKIGIAASLFGLLLIMFSTSGNTSIAGVLLVILGAFCWSLCNIIVRKHKPDNMFSFIIWSSIFSALPLFLITLAVKGELPFLELEKSLNAKAIFSILFQAYVTTVFGYWVWNSLMKKYPLSTVAPLSLLVPISGLLTSWIVYNENISWQKIIAASVIIFGIAIFLFSRSIDAWLKKEKSIE